MAFSLFILYCFDLHSESQGLCFHQHLESIVSPLSWLRFLSRADPGARPWMGILALGGDPRIARRGSKPPRVHQWAVYHHGQLGVVLPRTLRTAPWADQPMCLQHPTQWSRRAPQCLSCWPLLTCWLLLTCPVWGPRLFLMWPKNTSGDEIKESIL